jgi:hypothetical protein
MTLHYPTFVWRLNPAGCAAPVSGTSYIGYGKTPCVVYKDTYTVWVFLYTVYTYMGGASIIFVVLVYIASKKSHSNNSKYRHHKVVYATHTVVHRRRTVEMPERACLRSLRPSPNSPPYLCLSSLEAAEPCIQQRPRSSSPDYCRRCTLQNRALASSCS